MPSTVVISSSPLCVGARLRSAREGPSGKVFEFSIRASPLARTYEGSALAAPDRHGGHGRLGLARTVARGVGVPSSQAAHLAEEPSAATGDADPDLALLSGRNRERRPAQGDRPYGARARPPPGSELAASRAAADRPGRAAQPERDEPAAKGQPGGHEPHSGEGRRGGGRRT